MSKNSNFTQLPRLAGILPNNMFSEIFKYSRFFKILISIGRTPMNWLPDKSKTTSENEGPITYGNIKPMRLLLARFKRNKFWHLCRVRGILP